MSLEALVADLLYVAIVFMIVAIVVMIRGELRGREKRREYEEKIAELKKHIARLEEQLANKDIECYEKMQRLCGLERDAAALLDALENGEAVVMCKDGRPAAVIGGKLVCLERAQSS